MERIRVLLADDHPAFRAGIKAALDTCPEVTVIGEAVNGRDALQEARRLMPDVLLLDMEMPELDGLSVAKKLQEEESSILVLPLSGYSDPEFVYGVLENGAAGYIMKDESLTTIVEAIKAVINGAVYISPRVAVEIVRGQKLVHEKNSNIDRTYKDIAEIGITPKLLIVLKLTAEGYNNLEIAEMIGRSEHTVRNQISRLLTLTRVNWRPALVAWAWTNRIMLLDEDFYQEKYRTIKL